MRTVLGLVAASAMMAAVPASAATTLWFNTGGTGGSGGRTFTDGTVSVHVTGWSTNGVKAGLGQYASGLGVTSANDAEHTIDNNGTTKDLVILAFDRAVKLDQAILTTGWFNFSDTDATISRASLNYASAGVAFNSGNQAFWNAVVGQFNTNLYHSGSTGKSGNSTRGINPLDAASNVWLISAALNSPDTYKDSFKLKGVTYSLYTPPPPAVPEPATWAMLILGFGLVGGAMRRRVRTARVAYA